MESRNAHSRCYARVGGLSRNKVAAACRPKPQRGEVAELIFYRSLGFTTV